jgi:hypothetical protein
LACFHALTNIHTWICVPTHQFIHVVTCQYLRRS